MLISFSWKNRDTVQKSRYINYQAMKISFLLFYAVLRAQLYCTSVSLNLYNNSYPVLYKPVIVS